MGQSRAVEKGGGGGGKGGGGGGITRKTLVYLSNKT